MSNYLNSGIKMENKYDFDVNNCDEGSYYANAEI